MIEVDEKLWPLQVIRFVAPITMEELQEFSRKSSEALERQEPFISIVDSRKADGMTPEQRQNQADWLKRHDAAVRKYCLGNAFVLTSAMARVSMNVMMVLKPLPTPYTIVATLEAAAVWAAERLEATGRAEAAQRVRAVYAPQAQPQVRLPRR